jgi:hypothetical protein
MTHHQQPTSGVKSYEMFVFQIWPFLVNQFEHGIVVGKIPKGDFNCQMDAATARIVGVEFELQM